MRRLRSVIAAVSLLVCLASPVTASATDQPYSVLQRAPTAHGCMFASFTGTLHYNAVSDVVRGPRGSRRYQGLRVLDPTIAVWLMSSCRLTSAVYVREGAGASVTTAYHATSCSGMSLSDSLPFALGPVTGCKGRVGAILARSTVVPGYGIGFSPGVNLEFGNPIGGSAFCLTLGASASGTVGSPVARGGDTATYAPQVCIS
jgi:hypothetical protein